MLCSVVLTFDSQNFRQKIALSIISKKQTKIINIRKIQKCPGLKKFEIDLLCLVDKFYSGSIVKINQNGTILDFFPGEFLNRNVQHNIASIRSLSYYLEFIIYLFLISTFKTEIKLNGIRSINIDISLENILYVTIPLLRKLGLKDIRFKLFTNSSSSFWNTELIIFFPEMQIKKPIKLIKIGIINKFRIINTYSSVNTIFKKQQIEDFLSKFFSPIYFDLKILNIQINNKNLNFQTLSLITETTEGCIFGEDITFSVKESQYMNYNKIMNKIILSLFEDINSGSCVDKKNHIFLFLKILSNGKSNLSYGCLGKLSFLDIKFFRDLKNILGIFFSIKYDISNKLFIIKLA